MFAVFHTAPTPDFKEDISQFKQLFEWSITDWSFGEKSNNQLRKRGTRTAASTWEYRSRGTRMVRSHEKKNPAAFLFYPKKKKKISPWMRSLKSLSNYKKLRGIDRMNNGHNFVHFLPNKVTSETSQRSSFSLCIAISLFRKLISWVQEKKYLQILRNRVLTNDNNT